MKNIFFALFGAVLFVCAKCEDDDPMVDLPATIDQYLSKNYPDYTVDESEKGKLCTGTDVYEVELEGAKGKELGLVFDTEGNLLFTETEFSNQNLPAAVTQAIAQKYAGYELKESERLDWADGKVQYEVELKKSPDLLDVTFSDAGAVICEEPGDGD
jgi:Putative beta-lactamase-inhibitor-like, PepSY-like